MLTEKQRSIFFKLENVLNFLVFCALFLIAANGVCQVFLFKAKSILYFELRELSYFLFLLLSLLFLIKLISEKHFIKNIFKNIPKQFFVAFALLLWIVLSFVVNPDKNITFIGNGYRVEGLRSYLYYAVIFIAFYVQSKKQKNILIKCFVFTAAIVSLCVLCDPKGNIFEAFRYKGNTYLCAYFLNSNHFGYYLVMACIGSAALTLLVDGNKSFFYLIPFLINLIALIYNTSLGAYFATLLGIVFLLLACVLSGKNNIKNKIIALVAVYVLTQIGLYRSIIFDRIVNLFFNISSVGEMNAEQIERLGSSRIALWIDAIKYIKSNPWFGIGIDNYVYLKHDAVFLFDRPHNEFIQLALFCGIPALMLYVAFLVWTYINAIKNRKQLNNLQLVALSVSIAYLASSFFGNSMNYTTCYFMLFLAMIFHKNKSETVATANNYYDEASSFVS